MWIIHNYVKKSASNILFFCHASVGVMLFFDRFFISTVLKIFLEEIKTFEKIDFCSSSITFEMGYITKVNIGLIEKSQNTKNPLY